MNSQAQRSSLPRGPRRCGAPPRSLVKRSPIQPDPNDGRLGTVIARSSASRSGRRLRLAAARMPFSCSLTVAIASAAVLLGALNTFSSSSAWRIVVELVVAREGRLEVGEREASPRTPAPRRTTSGSSWRGSPCSTGTEALRAMICSCASGLARYLTSAQAASGASRVGVHDRAGRVDRGRLAGGAGRQRRDAEVDARGLVRRHQPRAVDLHRGHALLEGVTGLGEDRRVGHDLVLPDEVLEELDARRRPRAGRARWSCRPRTGCRRRPATRATTRRSPCPSSRCRGPTGRSCRRRPCPWSAACRPRSSLSQSQVSSGYGIPAASNMVLVVVERDHVEVARQAEHDAVARS